MTYGVRLVNDWGQINIDDNNPIYYVVQEGVYTQTVKYPNSIVFDESYRNTLQTPLVFVKPNTGGGQLCMLLKYFGSAGNWQGCEWYTTTVPGAAPGVVGGRYKVVVPFMPRSTGWGCMLWTPLDRLYLTLAISLRYSREDPSTGPTMLGTLTLLGAVVQGELLAVGSRYACGYLFLYHWSDGGLGW